ncbi:MAG: TonB-dependent receptor [Candidatus Cloacimonadota bacterium]|nr:MAG: TonB-dependent receptor [Candidatus Cloacimonadota bacterium]PIE78680.1 MAG: TonB-dependent receptor [Candidatus Delongbacteria bacterium]
MNKLSFSTFFLILFISATDLLSGSYGTISGRVINATTKSPLNSANVTIIGTKLGAETDSLGQFYITRVPVGLQRIKVEYIGYLPKIKTDISVSVGKVVSVSVEIKERSYQLEEAVFTLGYFPEDEKTETSRISLSSEEIRRFPGGFEDVVKTVSTLPGISINTSGGRNDLLVRGGGPSENLFLINDIEVPNINHFSNQGSSSGSLSFVNLEFVDDVSFSTGGFSVEYGDKMSSTLGLKIQDKKLKDFETKLNISASQYGLNFKTPLYDKGSLIFSARKSYLDLIFKAAGLPFVPVYTDFNLFLNYDLSPNDKLFFMGLLAIDEVDRDMSSEENKVKNGNLMDNSQNIFIGGINYRRLVLGGYLDFILSSNVYKYDFEQMDKDEVPYFSSNSIENETNLKINYFTTLSNKIGVKSGISYKRIFVDNETVFADSIYDQNGNKIPSSSLGLDGDLIQNNSSNKYSFYTDWDYILNSKLDFKFGIRWDYYDFLNNKHTFSPRGSIKYRYNPVLSFKLSGGIYYQSPSTVWMTNEANRDLKPLRNEMGVLGASYFVNDDFRLNVETYFKNYTDLPSGTIEGVNDHIVITNTGIGYGGREDNFQSFGYAELSSGGKAYSYGADISIQKKYSDTPYYGLASLSYSKTIVTPNNNKEYPSQYDQRVIFNLSGGYIFNPEWELAFKFRYYTGIPYTPVYIPSENPENPGFVKNIPDEFLEDRLSAGHHLDIRVDRTFNFKSSTLIAYVDIQNIYNYKLPEVPKYDFWENKINRHRSIGILPTIGLSYEF